MRFFTNPHWKRKIRKNAIKKLLGTKKIRRDATFVKEEYEKHWVEIKKYTELRLAERNGRDALVSHLTLMRQDIKTIHDQIQYTKPKRVLEIGSGAGIFLNSLALLNKDIEFTGIEATEAGIKASKKIVQEQPEIFSYLTGINTDVLIEQTAPISNTKWIQGDARSLPFESGSFDLVFSHLVIEQLPRDYPQVMREACRVTTSDAIFIEEFWEAQKNVYQKLHLWSQDYFRASIFEVQKFGFEIVNFDTNDLDKKSHSSGILHCIKSLAIS